MKNRFGFQHRQANQPNVTSDTIKPSSHLSKGNPQPQQQPNKTQKITQHQKQTHSKPPKNPNTPKNPLQQPVKNNETNQPTQNKMLQLLKNNNYSAIEQ
jgi:hypothetical protein